MTKFSQWYKEIGLPAGLLSSLIIGAGIFALPYVFYRAGLWAGLFYLIVFTVVFVAVHKMYARVIENTHGKHRFVGYAEIYLGKPGFVTAIFTTAVGFTLTLVAYISLASEFIRLVIPGIGNLYAPYVFWAIGSLSVVLSLKRIANLEIAITVAMGLIVGVLFFAGLFYGKATTIPQINPSNLLIPYGVVLFAMSGRAAISSLVDYYEKRKISNKKLMHSISLGTVVPAIIYVLFVFAVLFLTGNGISEDAISGLSHAPHQLLLLIGVLGILALLTSYFFLATEVKDIFRYDFKLNRFLALFAVVVLPMWLYVSGLRNFIWLVGVIGGVFLAMDSMMTIVIYSKIKGWRLSSKILISLFVIGGIFEIISLF